MQNTYNQQCYLWGADQDALIQAFAETKPLIVTIKEQFALYDSRTSGLLNTPKTKTIGAVIIHMDQAYNMFIEYSKTWKVKLGGRLNAIYKKELDEMVTFIKDMEFILVRPLRDLDDVRVAMNCLEKVRENSIE